VPRKNIYISDADEEFYQLAKKYAGDSLSSVIVNGLKRFVIEKQAEEKAMTEVTRWVGREEVEEGIANGHNIKFVGKLLGSGGVDEDSGVQRKYELFYTRKSMYLLYKVETTPDGSTAISSWKTYSSYKELMTVRLPNSVIEGIEKNMPDVVCEVLDI